MLLIPALLSFGFAGPLPGPSAVAPDDGATVGANVTFTVQTEQPTTIHVREVIDAEPFRLVVLPDTQFYTTEENIDEYGDLFAEQTGWIAENAGDITFVTHLGDIVQNWDDTEQWACADAAMSLLDDQVPYGMVLGNHDYPIPGRNKSEQALFNSYFPTSRFDAAPWWGGSYPEGSNDNNYQLFSVGGLDFLILHLKFEPEPDIRAWASGVIADHPDHRVIISTHSHLGVDGELWSHASYDAAALWTELVEPHDNVFLVLSAHFNGEARRTDTVDTRPVHQLLSCYQSEGAGGQGLLRLLDFHPEQDRIDVSTYTPWSDTWREGDESLFSLDYKMTGFSLGGAADPTGAATIDVTWTAPRSGAYEWYAESEDGQRSALWTFSADADAPTILQLEVSGQSDRARVDWETDEPTTGTLFIDGEEAARTSDVATEHTAELTGLSARFSLLLVASDAVGNETSEEVQITLDGAPDSGATSDGGATSDTGQLGQEDPPLQSRGDPASGGCGCAGVGARFSVLGLVFLLLVPFRRAATSGSSSVR